MGGPLVAAARNLLFRIDPETAHGLSIKALHSPFVPHPPHIRDSRLVVETLGLKFPSPVGMAAGYDKNAEVPNALLKLGFGFVEVGTVTPQPQDGNPRPRIFRLVDDEAIINRLGFNNHGHEAALRRLKRRARRMGIVGVNIGANKDSADRIADYTQGIRTFHSVADYFTVNVSSPNTPGLRDLQARDSLAALMDAVMTARNTTANISGKRVPVLLKIAPDLDEMALDDIASVLSEKSVDGLIVSNTTLARDGLASRRHVEEAGGLSGRPVFERSTIVLAKMRQRVGPALPIVGVGGVDTPEAALTKISAGADLVQLYTGFIYHGPLLARQVADGLLSAMERDGVEHISAYRDRAMEEWAARSLPRPSA